MYILVISRDLAHRQRLLEGLVGRGYLAAAVTTLSEALDLVRNARPALVVVDGRLPALQKEVARIRDTRHLDAVPLVALTEEAPDAQWLDRARVSARLASDDPLPVLVDRMEMLMPA